MNRDTIWKYELEYENDQTIQTPRLWKPLHIGMQNGAICLWAEVDSEDSDIVERRISVHGTGHPLRVHHHEWSHLGTTVDENLGLVWHVYYKGPLLPQ